MKKHSEVVARGWSSGALIAALSAVSFPLSVEVTNLMPTRISLPEVGAYFKAVGSDGSIAEIVIGSTDQLIRLISDVEQIAELNDYQNIVQLSFLAGVDSDSLAKAEAEAKAETPDLLSGSSDSGETKAKSSNKK